MDDQIINPAALRVIKLLVGKPPQTVADLIDATGVTRTAITEQLNELESIGLVSRGTRRLPTRGRPRHTYEATPASLTSLLTNHHEIVVPAMWKAIGECGGRKLIEDVLQQLSRELAKRYAKKITSKNPRKRLTLLAQLLREEGIVVEVVEQDGQLVLLKRSCQYISMLDDDRLICCLDLAMMTEVVGAPLQRTSYRHEGDHCCVFKLNGKA